MNLDQENPVGKPTPLRLVGFKYVRLPFRWRHYAPHNETIQQAITRQQAYIQSLTASGVIVIVIVGHENGLEGRGYPFDRMTDTDWTRCIDEYVANLKPVARALGGANTIFQIWNEPDGTQTGSSVLMPPHVYGWLYNAARTALRSEAPGTLAMVAGLKSGPEAAHKYYHDSGIDADMIGIHEYGRGDSGDSVLEPFGSLVHSLSYWRQRIGNKPLFMTEWGVLNASQLPVDRVAKYAQSFVATCQRFNVPQLWYGWGEGMHNGYGVVSNGQIRTSLLNALKPSTATTPPPPVSGDSWVRYTLEIPYGLNVRSSPVVGDNIIHTLAQGSHTVDIDERSFEAASNHRWKRIRLSNAAIGWIALLRGQVRRML